MSRQSQKADEETGAIDLTPMLDVVFIMLIFFIVTASFVKEPGVEINRPDSTTSEIKKNAKVLVAIDEENKVWINKSQYEINQVESQIAILLAENPNSAFVIQSDSGSNIKTIAEVSQAARDAGLSDISVSTMKK